MLYVTDTVALLLYDELTVGADIVMFCANEFEAKQNNSKKRTFILNEYSI